ncbi:hypothetical protein GCM10023107_00720 [Actinoplanes octamycinicus]|uniref:sensor histidine kinase n=1 Tax=Actinoplanes octamycinicus TaxID=135948 RepID=UPI0031EA8193
MAAGAAPAAALVSPALWLATTAALPPVAGRVLAVGLAAGQVLALWWLDRAPRRVTAVVLLAAAALQLVVPSLGPGLVFVVLCTYAWARPAGESLWALGGTVLAVCGPAVAQQRWVPAGLWFGASLLAWSWGALGRARGARREAERRQAVLEERGRIARELHDVLSHTVSVMVVQAAAADDIFDHDPGQAREAIRRTEAAGRDALAELRTFLRTVRDGEPADHRDREADLAGRTTPPGDRDREADLARGIASPGDRDPDTDLLRQTALLSGQGREADPAGRHDAPPQPTLADVERLVVTMNGSGLTVTLRREGDAEPPAGVQLSAYRIVQEALTNTLRHSGAATAEVLIRVAGTELDLEVRDHGHGRPGAVPGNGLTGMRERVAVLGGELTAGPAPGGGFLVRARLPWQVAG